MHHSEQPMQPSAVDKDFLERKIRELSLGATGRFPQGKIDPHDEGEIKISIGTKENKVVVSFGKSISWIGFDKAQALEISETLKKHAESIG